jgi:hypothetical protein
MWPDPDVDEDPVDNDNFAPEKLSALTATLKASTLETINFSLTPDIAFVTNTEPGL